ncbi:PLAC8-domain-containing protein [Neolentinus lepideus HHB14362 ss-1]|uniref:PLAC8-domain-containing protein n=1 Tax=Neolentinus lepideus HHB14362 ss-1 TaxID=1314782 RepID=A0A165QPK1_9AGAM|nr:PLAC8-domain-containing protein [Neolentinus lepideus HHB14362 ss-1]
MADYQYQQPMATQGMSFSPGGNRNAKSLPYDSNGEREWSNGICGCFDSFGTACLAIWCPCIAYSRNKSRVEYLEKKGVAHPDGGDSCTGDCCCYTTLGLFGFGWILQMGTRAAVRTRYRIKGGGFGDCCTAWCCTCCELTQESQELELEEQSLTGR